MKNYILIILLVIAQQVSSQRDIQVENTDSFIVCTINPSKFKIELHLKDNTNKNIRDLELLETLLQKEKQKLLFATNAGMYLPDGTPLGLYIEDSKVIRPMNKATASGNFYKQPNGVFYLTNNNKVGICKSTEFKTTNIKHATQSGPMLLVDGSITETCKIRSSIYIRSGIGILKDGRLLFILTKEPVTFYTFASYFKQRGCVNALYLDGCISGVYLPQQKYIYNSNLYGPILAVTE